MDFISIGEMVIDFLPGEEAGSYVRNAGGAPANVAIAAARNGLESGMYCKVGNDDFGRFLIGVLEENHVKPLSPALCDEATTTMAFVSLTEDNERSFTFARKPGADMMLSRDEIKDEDLQACRILNAGSCSLSAGEAAEATRYAMKRAHELGKMVAFDVNYRNLMWHDDKQACTAAVETVLPYVDLLKLSEEEVDMVGGEEHVPDAMEKYGIAVTVLTRGKDGATYFFKGKSYSIEGSKVEKVADTTGAGDAFWGAFLSKLLIEGIGKVEKLTEEKLREAVIYGNVSGSLAVGEKGAIASLPTRERIEKFLQENRRS